MERITIEPAGALAFRASFDPSGENFAMISRPGWLTLEYLAGRRARYVHPFKLYFAFSLVFFLVFSISGYSIVRVDEPDQAVRQAMERIHERGAG